MARLIVTAFSEDTIAAPGNRQPNYIVVSITDTKGAPVTGLTIANFKVDPMIVGPGGALVNITGVTPGRLPGFYHVNVVPINTQTWKAECTFLPRPSSEVRTKGRLSLLFSWTEATSAALGAARGIWRLTYRCINQTGPCLPRRPGERSGLVHASNRKSSILGVNQSPYFVGALVVFERCMKLLRLSKKSKWPILIILAPLKINNLQATENRKTAQI